MARGDFALFEAFLEKIGDSVFNLSTDTFKLGLINNTSAPTAADADPRWGNGGTTDHSANEVTPGGNYAAGGISLSAVITDNWALAGGNGVFDGDNVSITQHASSPTNSYWGILYDYTSAGKEAIGYLDLGGPVDLSGGDFNITWNGSGIFRLV